MLNYQIELYEQNQWQPLKGWARPFTDGTTLDDTLDAGMINLSCVTRREPIKPFTRLRIIVKEDGIDKTQIQRVVSSSRKIQKTFAPSVVPHFDWQIETVELTKLLEREVCDSMTVTNSLIPSYEKMISHPVIVTAPNLPKNMVIEEASGYIAFETPLPLGIYNIPHLTLVVYVDTSKMIPKPDPDEAYAPRYFGRGYCKVTNPKGETAFYTTDYLEDGKVNFDLYGQWNIEYKFSVVHYNPNGMPLEQYDDNTFKYSLYIYDNVDRIKQWTITQVCERLLNAGITRRNNIEKPRYVLNAAFAEKYKDFKSPEFYFTRSTLFEALLQVGGRIHAIPRLIASGADDMTLEVTFDELGGSETVDWPLPPKIYEDKAINIDDFCGTLDSPAQNILNTQDRINGAISEPDNNAYITIRTEESQIQIDANNPVIRLNYPANQVIKVECGYLPDGTLVGDISSYIYENAEYQTLSSYWGTPYPFSKAFALKYTKGDNKITALTFKIEKQTSVATAFDNPAIINIIKAKTGKTIGATDIINLAFRVTYVPIITTRVTQRKPYTNGFPIENTLIYNQNANTAETSFYGEKMKGAIARLGNEMVQRTYDFYHYDQIPKCGQILDGMYVARVDCSYDIVKIRATLLLTKNFNQLAQYVGLDSNYRLYDISEKQSVDRYVHYAENLLIGDRVQTTGAKPIIKNTAQSIVDTIKQAISANAQRITTAVATNKSITANDDITKTILPVVSFPFGNAICFSIGFVDNFGAGYQSTNEYENEGNKRVQRLVPYGDALGEMEALGIDYYSRVWNPTLADQQDGGRANLYPEYAGGFEEQYLMGTTGENPYIIQKDNREAIHHIYQMHFIANRESIVLGSRLTTYNPLVSVIDEGKKGELYFFSHTLNMLDSIIDLSSAVKSNISVDVIISAENANTAKISGIKNDSGQVVQAWGIIDPTTKMLYIGENVLLQPNDIAPDIYFNATDNTNNQ